MLYIYIYIYVQPILWNSYFPSEPAKSAKNSPPSISEGARLWQACQVIMIPEGLPCRVTANLRTKILDFSGFDAASVEEKRTPNLLTKVIPAKIAWFKLSGKFPMVMGIPPLKMKITLESNPLISGVLVRRLAAGPEFRSLMSGERVGRMLSAAASVGGRKEGRCKIAIDNK